MRNKERKEEDKKKWYVMRTYVPPNLVRTHRTNTFNSRQVIKRNEQIALEQ